MNMYKSALIKSDFHPDTQKFFSGKNVVVTGGSGFIGSHVVEALIELGAKPIVPTRQKDPEFLATARGKYSMILCDLFDRSQVKSVISKADIVMNLAASVAGLEYNAKHPATIFRHNLEIFMNVIQAAADKGVERFLVTSSACVYPRHCSIPTPEEEGIVGEPEPTNSGYGWSKRMEEYLGAKYAEEYGLSVAIARPYNAYGPRDNFSPEKSHVIPALIRKAMTSEDGNLPVWGDGTHSRSFLYVDDFARGLIEVAARYPEADPLNIGNDEEVTIRETAENIASIVSEIRGTKIIPVFNPRGLTGQPRRRCSTQKCEEKINYRAKVPLPEGLRKTIEWYVTYAHRSVPAHV